LKYANFIKVILSLVLLGVVLLFIISCQSESNSSSSARHRYDDRLLVSDDIFIGKWYPLDQDDDGNEFLNTEYYLSFYTNGQYSTNIYGFEDADIFGYPDSDGKYEFNSRLAGESAGMQEGHGIVTLFGDNGNERKFWYLYGLIDGIIQLSFGPPDAPPIFFSKEHPSQKDELSVETQPPDADTRPSPNPDISNNSNDMVFGEEDFIHVFGEVKQVLANAFGDIRGIACFRLIYKQDRLF
jgi:hypothetical protein